jgi:protein gp37
MVFGGITNYSILGRVNDLNEIFVKIFTTIKDCPQHTFFMLTKRPHLAKDIFNEAEKLMTFPLPNLWIGVSAENQQAADERISVLLDIPAAGHFVSVEPMLEKVNLIQYLYGNKKLDWVICGAETGKNKRHMKIEWAFNLMEQCREYNVPFFFKKDSNGNDKLDGKIVREFPKFHNETTGLWD